MKRGCYPLGWGIEGHSRYRLQSMKIDKVSLGIFFRNLFPKTPFSVSLLILIASRPANAVFCRAHREEQSLMVVRPLLLQEVTQHQTYHSIFLLGQSSTQQVSFLLWEREMQQVPFDSEILIDRKLLTKNIQLV